MGQGSSSASSEHMALCSQFDVAAQAIIRAAASRLITEPVGFDSAKLAEV